MPIFLPDGLPTHRAITRVVGMVEGLLVEALWGDGRPRIFSARAEVPELVSIASFAWERTTHPNDRYWRALIHCNESENKTDGVIDAWAPNS